MSNKKQFFNRDKTVVGVQLPRLTYEKLGLHTINSNVSKSNFVRSLIEEWFSKEDISMESIIDTFCANAISYLSKNPQQRFKDFQNEIKTNLISRKISEDTVNYILNRIVEMYEENKTTS